MENKFAVLIFFSILSIIATTIFSSIIISKTSSIKSSIEDN